jgi:hypothetical protein
MSDDLSASTFRCHVVYVENDRLRAPPIPAVKLVQTGVMKTDERGARVREVRRRLAQDGPPWMRYERDFETVVEVGLAYASSALAIGEALVKVDSPHPRHVIIDSFQTHAYSDVGWDLLRAAGLDSIARLMRAWSSIALPQLVTEGLVADLVDFGANPHAAEFGDFGICRVRFGKAKKGSSPALRHHPARLVNPATGMPPLPGYRTAGTATQRRNRPNQPAVATIRHGPAGHTPSGGHSAVPLQATCGRAARRPGHRAP